MSQAAVVVQFTLAVKTASNGCILSLWVRHTSGNKQTT